eukprot:13731743-Alexandrium_andersonii.AAC.1
MVPCVQLAYLLKNDGNLNVAMGLASHIFSLHGFSAVDLSNVPVPDRVTVMRARFRFDALAMHWQRRVAEQHTVI